MYDLISIINKSHKEMQCREGDSDGTGMLFQTEWPEWPLGGLTFEQRSKENESKPGKYNRDKFSR